jgi:acetolactate synthase-1/2/3 large subunit
MIRPSTPVAPVAPVAPVVALAVVISLAVAACGGKLPDTHYYQLAAPESKAGSGDNLLVLDTLTTDAAYDDDRIVYRTTPFRLDYYQYQRWSSTPGLMVGNYLEQALETSGKFRAVMRELTPDAPVVLAGRVVAIEEVDRSNTLWVGRIALELVIVDDGGYGMLRFDQQVAGDAERGVDLVGPDWVALAGSYGIGADVVTDPGAGLRAALDRAADSGQPRLVLLRAALYPPRTTSPRWSD